MAIFEKTIRNKNFDKLLSLRMSKKLSSILISIGKTDDTSFIGWFCGAIRFFIFRSHFFCFLLTMPR